nr:hypothetical protein ABT39_MTgene4018 [Picea glauca]
MFINRPERERRCIPSYHQMRFIDRLIDYPVRSRHKVLLAQILENLPLPVVGGAARILAPYNSWVSPNKIYYLRGTGKISSSGHRNGFDFDRTMPFRDVSLAGLIRLLVKRLYACSLLGLTKSPDKAGPNQGLG